MATITFAVNFPSADKPFAWGVAGAAELGLHRRRTRSTPTRAIPIQLSTQNSYEWLEHVRGRLVHLHAVDINVEQGGNERSKATVTPLAAFAARA